MPALGFAVDTNSGDSAGSSCIGQNKDSHRYFNFGIVVPSTAFLIAGIEVRLDAMADSTVGSPLMCVELSWNGGVTWTQLQQTPTLTTSEVTYILGGIGDTWGRVWTGADFLNGNIQVRITNASAALTTDFYLDWVAVKVNYYQSDLLVSSALSSRFSTAGSSAGAAMALGFRSSVLDQAAPWTGLWENAWSGLRQAGSRGMVADTHEGVAPRNWLTRWTSRASVSQDAMRSHMFANKGVRRTVSLAF